MEELFTLLRDFKLIDIVLIIVLASSAAEWGLGKFVKFVNWFRSSKKSYHKKESEKEDKEETIETRLQQLEDCRSSQFKRIDVIEANLLEIQNANEQQNQLLNQLSNNVRDIRLESMRNKILDAVPKCIDLDHSNVSSEFYTNLFQTYTDYENILKENNMENSQCYLAMRMIRASYNKRLAAQLLTDYHYLSSEEINYKLKKAEDAISWWHEKDLDLNGNTNNII